MHWLEPATLNVPGPQLSHPAWLYDAWDVPAGQLEHGAAWPYGEYFPGVQSAQDAWPLVDAVPGPHASHDVWLALPWYLPAGQGVHTLFDSYLPA